jgi:hypothetical protein
VTILRKISKYENQSHIRCSKKPIEYSDEKINKKVASCFYLLDFNIRQYKVRKLKLDSILFEN